MCLSHVGIIHERRRPGSGCGDRRRWTLEKYFEPYALPGPGGSRKPVLAMRQRAFPAGFRRLLVLEGHAYGGARLGCDRPATDRFVGFLHIGVGDVLPQ